MLPDFHEITNYLLGCLIAAGGYVMKKNFNRLENLEEDIKTKITEQKSRQLIQDLQEPIRVVLLEIKDDIKEIKSDLKSANKYNKNGKTQ